MAAQELEKFRVRKEELMKERKKQQTRHAAEKQVMEIEFTDLKEKMELADARLKAEKDASKKLVEQE